MRIWLNVTALALAGGAALWGAAPPASASEDAMTATSAGGASCVIPALPRPGSAATTNGAPRMTGPAVTSLTGGAARQAFTLDRQNLLVQPPSQGDHPVLTRRQAECDALASLNDQNAPLSGGVGSGVAIGYGRVTVTPSFFPPPSGPPGTDTTPGDVQPRMPPSTPYVNRLAWVVVLTHQIFINCPAQTSAPATAVRLPTDYFYDVFIVDARTGRNALVYSESQPGQCGFATRIPASLIQPKEEASVPWTLRSRNPNGYSGTIVASMLPCDGYSDPVLIDRPGSGLQVVVIRPVGASCGPVRAVTLTVHAATVTSSLPAVITHDPTGLYTGSATSRLATPTVSTGVTTTLPRLINVGSQANGSTISMKVGEAIAVLPDENLLTSPIITGSPVVSIETAVLGGLAGAQPAVAEFRAFKRGRADLEVPARACKEVVTGQAACWVVHIVVR